MIVPMQRAYLFFLKSAESNALKKLRSLGFFHLDGDPAFNEDIEAVQQKVKMAEQVLDRLALLEKGWPVRNDDVLSQSAIAARINELYQLLEQETKIKEKQQQAERDVQLLLPWGEFNPMDLATLQQSGGCFELLQLNSSELKKLNESVAKKDCYCWEFGQLENKRRCVAVFFLPDKQRPDFLPTALRLPEHGLAKLDELQQQCTRDLARVGERMRSFLYLQSNLQKYIADLMQQIEFESIREGLFAVDDKIVYLTGFLPLESTELLSESAARYGWGLMLRAPEEEEPVPTKLRQNFISRLINPVLSFLDITPGYREADTTSIFFLFFTIFVAMLVGDAAYGVAIVLIAITLQLVKYRNTTLIAMIYVLGLATLIWGLLSGAWFGSYFFAQQPFLRQMSIWQLSNFPQELFNKSASEQQLFIMMFCFTLGAIHLSIARLWNFVRKLPRLQAWANLGTVALIVSLYQLVIFMVGAIPNFAPIYKYLLAGGFTTLVIFGQQEKGQNFFVGVGKGLAGLFTVFLDTVGVFGDIMSYVRLFAVGIASFSIASSFNGMGMGIIAQGSVMVVFGIIVMVLGHLINFALAGLAIIVHAVRLNILEFSNHMGIEWGGMPYKPFEEKSINL